MIRRNLRLAVCITLGLASQLLATTVLTFTGLHDGEQVLNFYNGGTGSLGSYTFNYGVGFTPGTVAVIDSDVGGSGNFANAPSPFAVLYTTTGLLSFNVPEGFTEALTFYYVTYAGGASGSVKVFSGLDGSGQQLGTATLDAVNLLCPGDPQGSYFGCWQSASISVAGAAKSVIFELPIAQFYIDNISLTLPSIENPGDVQSPEPASWTLAAAALSIWLLKRQRA